MNDGFERGTAASTILYQNKTHVCDVVHGDDFTFAATESELIKIRSKMCEKPLLVLSVKIGHVVAFGVCIGHSIRHS